jgi:hypothetical protein
MMTDIPDIIIRGATMAYRTERDDTLIQKMLQEHNFKMTGSNERKHP